MAYTKIALLAAFSAFAFAQTQEEIDELNVILNDVKSNLQEYISLASDSSSGFSLSSLPSGVLDIGMAIASATDDSYTTLYSEVDFAAVSKMLTMVPWYSSRLEPALESLLGTSATTTSSAVATTSSAVATTSSVVATTSSAVATTSSAAATTSSAAATTSSAAATTSSAAATASSADATTSSADATTSSAKVSTVVSSAKTSGSVSAISQITDGQVQATSTVAEQTENGAAKVAVGMGAGIMAAAAMLL
ncbi:Tir2p [Saccharomyces cerevisiae x Saccharomyces kudriavzevii VIN7]|uniref:Tir2p n=1 Tax=Saccharomyces cerevisiae x Saccharomyces kudriavzevii (strain VIN7) TaxID=1095631 RepID=H0H0Y6_SACCK|nr:Tir2p [Saccharomyces cerevisiae x Saccharomyces kudriavzevii VIN7]